MPNTPPVTATPATPATVDPGLTAGVEGTSLWNLQTQAPEWTPLTQVSNKLASGAYRTYEGSNVPVSSGIGAEGELSPTAAASAVAAGATPTHSEATRDLAARKADYANQFNNAGDKAVATVDGLISGLSGGLIDKETFGSKYSKLIAASNKKENSGYETLGELAALAGVILAPESALKYTPLGGSNVLFSGASKATESTLSALSSPLLKKGISEAVGGAVASGALSSAHAVGQAVQGKPVSGQAIIDDIGLGTLIGGGLGVVGAKLAGYTSKLGEARKQIEAAARFDESATEIRGILSDVSTSWHSAHNIAGARVDALDDLAKAGMLDGELTGTEWLAARTDAKVAADKAQAALHKVAGTDQPIAIAERLHDLAVSGKAKDAEKLYKAFDEYGTAVSRLDDAMQPTTFDTAHLHDVIGDIDLRIPSSEHPLQRLEEMINNGVPQEEIEAFVKQYDENFRRSQGHGGPNDETLAPPAREPSANSERPTGDIRGGRRVAVEGESAEPAVRDEFSPPDEDMARAAIRQQEPPGKFVDKYEPGRPTNDVSRGVDRGVDIGAGPNDDLAVSKLLGGSTAGSDVAGFQAKKILSQVGVERATGVLSPVRPTDLGNKIQGLMDQLTAATGNRLGSAEARKLATQLGMNSASMTGPVASRLSDLWSLHRMSESLANQLATRAPESKRGLLSRALAWGSVSGAGAIGYEAGGPFAGGAVRSLMRTAISSSLIGVGHVTAVAGRFRQSAVNGLTKALSPAGKRTLGMGTIQRVISSTYKPNDEATTDFATKAAQLRMVAANPDVITKHAKDMLKGVGAVDPIAYTAAVNAVAMRVQNLAKALPTVPTLSVMVKNRGPSPAQIHEWNMYEAATADRELVFKYLKAGSMPQSIVEAMNEQHPDFMNEIKEYVLNNQSEVQSASHDTQMALSRLLGVPLVPEASPAFVQRMQEPYNEAKQKAAQAKQQAQGAQALRAPQPTAAQILVLPH